MQTAKTDLLRVVQVSDTHLSESHAWFTANWPVFVDAMRNDPPELIVTSGDLSFNGPANPEDLAIAAGHIHQHTVTAHLGMQIVTAPATSFVNAGFSSPAELCATRTGYLRWTFDGQALRHDVVRPRLFQSVDMSNWTEAAKTTTNLPPRHLGAPMS